MNENAFFDIETGAEQTVNPVYSSKYVMDKELYYEFSLVSYNRTKKMFLIFLCLMICLVVTNLLAGDYKTIIGSSAIVTFLATFVYVRMKKATKIGYERMEFTGNAEYPMHHELFEDKIVSYNYGVKNDYFYHQVTSFYETKNLLLLQLKYNLCITLNKNNLNANADEVKSFLMRKCSLVKKNRFVNCSKDKKWSLAFFISLIVICVIGTVAGIAVPAIYNKPTHFRDIKFSTTRTDIREIYGNPSLETEDEYCDRYEAEFLGVNGTLEFMYLRDGATLYNAQFVIDSKDFKTYVEYQKAVNKTLKHFNKTLSGYQTIQSIDEQGINATWSKTNEEREVYLAYATQISDDDYVNGSRLATVFQYTKLYYSK